MPTIKQGQSFPPNADTTNSWLTSHADNSIVKPNLVVRMATDSHWIFHHNAPVPNYNFNPDAAAIMNCGTPGMRIPGITNWSVQESIDSVVQTASMELTNALPLSQKTTTLTQALPAQYHGTSLRQNWIRNGDNTIGPVGTGMLADESRLVYREFNQEQLACANISGWPDPRVPADESDANTVWSTSAAGQGAYFVLVDQEVVRVIDIAGNSLYIPPGGRGVNGLIQDHQVGATVTLLGFGPFQGGKWAAMGYLTNNEFRTYRSMIRPGTCFVSYEGYGDFHNGALTKAPWGPNSNRAYDFTGYWFVRSIQASISEDGVPKATVELASTGWVLQHQKITQNSVYRLRNQLINWAKATFDQVGHTRTIPGDWVDFSSWEPDRPGAYPLAVKTEFAQHKQFFDHMASSGNGKDCEFCQTEWLEYVSRPNYTQGSNPVGEARAVGRHIYKESIRVYNDGNPWTAGPLMTYGRLMIKLAQVSWEIPVYGNPLAGGFMGSAQRWTKIPNALWDNMCNFNNSRVWNGQLSFVFEGEWVGRDGRPSGDYNYGAKTNTIEDTYANYFKDYLMCPFESSYDKQDWYQPLQDLADMNRMSFQFDRQGYPIFIPRGMLMRGRLALDNPDVSNGHWFMSWGGAISSYTFNFNADDALSLVYVSGTTAFDSEFSVAAGGTGNNPDGRIIWYSSITGNKEALQLTGGVQQIDTVALDNLTLGLDWFSDPASWSLRVDRTSAGQGITQISKMPAIPAAGIAKGSNNNPASVRGLQKLYNFLRMRAYINAVQFNGQFIELLNVDGNFGDEEEAICIALQTWIKQQSNVPFLMKARVIVDGTWGSPEFQAFTFWATDSAEYIKKDVWWYALGGYDWLYFVSAVTGLPIPQRLDDQNSQEDGGWVVDQIALRQRVEDWQKKYFKQAINIGNRVVDDSINKSLVRTVSSNLADPRILVGDVVYFSIPGYLDSADDFGITHAAEPLNPVQNATYITQISRTMDMTNGTYSATYSGYRYRPEPDQQFGKNKDNYWDGVH